MVFNVFSDNKRRRHAGYNFGPGWWGVWHGLSNGFTNSREPLGWGQNRGDASARHDRSFTRQWHTYALDVLVDGTVSYYVDGALVRTFKDKRFSEGSVGVSPSCRHIDVAEIKIMAPKSKDYLNIAKGKSTRQSSYGWGSTDGRRAVDGNTNSRYGGRSCTHTRNNKNSWWRVDLGSSRLVGTVKIQNRGDCCGYRLQDFQIQVGNYDSPFRDVGTGKDNTVDGKDSGQKISDLNHLFIDTAQQWDPVKELYYDSSQSAKNGIQGRKLVFNADKAVPGQYVFIQYKRTTHSQSYLTLCEVEVEAKSGNVISNSGVNSDLQGWGPVGTNKATTKIELVTATNADGFDDGYLSAKGPDLLVGQPGTGAIIAGRKYRLSATYRASSGVSSNSDAYGFSFPKHTDVKAMRITEYFEATGDADLQFSVTGPGAFLQIDDISLETVANINRAHIDLKMPDNSPLVLTGLQLGSVEAKARCGDLTLAKLGADGYFHPTARIQADTAAIVKVRAGEAKVWRLQGMATELDECAVNVNAYARLQDPKRTQCKDACTNLHLEKNGRVAVSACKAGCDFASIGASTKASNGLVDVDSCEQLPAALAARGMDGTVVSTSANTCTEGQASYAFGTVVACASGMKIREITFASYGTPLGSCSNPLSMGKGTCHAPKSSAIASQLCIGKQSCTLYATNEAFGVDPCQGTRKKLIVEAACVSAADAPKKRLPYILSVTARDSGGLQTTTEVRVEVINENEPPRFPPQTRRIKENTPSGRLVDIPLEFSDDDKDDVKLALVGGSGASMFSLNTETGQISTALSAGTSLDFEAQPTYTLRIRATDNGPSGSQSTWTDVTVALEDVNEAPQVLDSRFLVSESVSIGGSVGTLLASDEDRGDQMTYRIDTGNEKNIFAIDYATGDLLLRKMLDYETQKKHVLEVIATDSGSLSTLATVTVLVGNANEAPIFERSKEDADGNMIPVDYTRNVDEGKGVRIVEGGVVASTDEDEKDKGKIKYKLKDTSAGLKLDEALFSIHEDTAVISTADYDFDYEVSPNVYHVIVQATDLDSAVSEVKVTIRIDDVNEPPLMGDKWCKTCVPHKPLSSKRAQENPTLGVGENFNSGQFVGTLTAWDQDLLNSQTKSFTIVGGNDCKLTSCFLSPDVNNWDLITEAIGSGYPAKTVKNVGGSKPLSLKYDDQENCENNGGKWVRKACPASYGGTFTLKSDGSLYVRKDSLEENVGNVNQPNNQIQHVHTNDFLKVGETYTLRVQVSDGYDSEESDVVVTVFEQNDPPSIGDRTIDSCPEQSHVNVKGRACGKNVRATDKDGDKLTYSIVGGNVADAWTIDMNTGQLYVSSVQSEADALDFEARQEWALQIQVQDDGKGTLTAVATWRVRLVDINEYPVIQDQFRRVAENALADTNVGAPIVANDVDTLKNWGVLRYFLVGGNDKNIFKIHKTTGQITVRTELLDFELRASYALTVRVIDTVGSGLQSEAVVTVTLVNQNDAPVLERFVTARTIEENAIPGTMVGTKLRSSDQDAYDSLSFKMTGANCWSKSINGASSTLHYFPTQMMLGKDGTASLRIDAKADANVVIAIAEKGNTQDRYEVTVSRNGASLIEAKIFIAGKPYNMRCTNNRIQLLKKNGQYNAWSPIWMDVSSKGVVRVGQGDIAGRGGDYATCTVVTSNGFQARLDGYCHNGRSDQNSGVRKLSGGDYNSAAKQEECLAKCANYPGYTGCEMIWSQGNRGCYVHTRTVTGVYARRGAGRHYCFLKDTSGLPVGVGASSVSASMVGVAAIGGTAAQFSSACFATKLDASRGGGVVNGLNKAVAAPADAGEIFIVDRETGQITLSCSRCAA
jgi:hypothetical protein